MKTWFRFTSVVADIAFAASIVNYHFCHNTEVAMHIVMTAIFLKVQGVITLITGEESK